jgi:hypothetical protein
MVKDGPDAERLHKYLHGCGFETNDMYGERHGRYAVIIKYADDTTYTDSGEGAANLHSRHGG